MWQAIETIFSPSQYISHGSCYLWQTPLAWLHITSYFLIAVAYFSIPAMSIYVVKKRWDLKFRVIFYLLSAFIILYGTGYRLEISTLWHPVYLLSGIQQTRTVLVSCYTVLNLVELLPQFVSLQNPDKLDRLNQTIQIEIAEIKLSESPFKNIVAGTATATGQDFFPALVIHLAKALDVTYVLGSETVGKLPKKLTT